jgi:hypothetical protein
MAPVAVTSIGATTSSSEGGGVCVCCWWMGAVAVREALVDRDDVIGVGMMGVSAQTQYVPSLQKPQLSRISTEMMGLSCCWESWIGFVADVSWSGCFFCCENMAVKSISIAEASRASDLCRFSLGKKEDDGELGGRGRLRSDIPAVAACSDSKHSHLESNVHLPQPMGVLARSSAHEHGPVGGHDPQVRLPESSS